MVKHWLPLPFFHLGCHCHPYLFISFCYISEYTLFHYHLEKHFDKYSKFFIGYTNFVVVNFWLITLYCIPELAFSFKLLFNFHQKLMGLKLQCYIFSKIWGKQILVSDILTHLWFCSLKVLRKSRIMDVNFTKHGGLANPGPNKVYYFQSCPMSHILCTLCTVNSTNIPNKVPLIKVWIWAMKMWTIVSLLQTIPPGCNLNELPLPVESFTIYRKLIWYF